MTPASVKIIGHFLGSVGTPALFFRNRIYFSLLHELRVVSPCRDLSFCAYLTIVIDLMFRPLQGWSSLWGP